LVKDHRLRLNLDLVKLNDLNLMQELKCQDLVPMIHMELLKIPRQRDFQCQKNMMSRINSNKKFLDQVHIIQVSRRSIINPALR